MGEPNIAQITVRGKTMAFRDFKLAVAKQFAKVAENDLFLSSVTKDEIWECYLSSFPPGTNEVFRVRREYDCGACAHFIRNVGRVVAIVDGELVSIWDDIQTGTEKFDIVAKAMSKLIRNKPIQSKFLSYERTAGRDKDFESITDPDGKSTVLEWEHFFANIPSKCFSTTAHADMQETKVSHDLFLRACSELTLDSVETVLDLIAQDSLYRGEESKSLLENFQALKREFEGIDVLHRDNWIWDKCLKIGGLARIRNMAIGTLLVNLSENMDLEDAVKAFETIMAPTNYKRPTAIITPRMIDDAKKKIQDLGLLSALERRFATMDDIGVNDILYIDRSLRPIIGNEKVTSENVFDVATKSVTETPRNFSKVEKISIEKFITEIVPRATKLEIMPEGRHEKNLFSLIAPIDPTAGQLFKWNNRFSWSYKGGITDSIKEKVKAAGGRVDAPFCFRLAWYNFDDLDLHLEESDGNYICFQHCRLPEISSMLGTLDVDMNAGGGHTRTPVENIFYRDLSRLKPGFFTCYVHQFCQREKENVGFEVEIEINGEVSNFVYRQAVPSNSNRILVAKIEYMTDGTFKFIETPLESNTMSKEIWGISTNQFVPVHAIMNSPNFWENSGSNTGNRHFFFALQGCKNPDPARGFFNEFLKEELTQHRKVFEVIGGKIKAEPTDNQVSGLGFSSTQRDNILCRVSGSFNRVVSIEF
jgi:hypothetical protein